MEFGAVVPYQGLRRVIHPGERNPSLGAPLITREGATIIHVSEGDMPGRAAVAERVSSCVSFIPMQLISSFQSADRRLTACWRDFNWELCVPTSLIVMQVSLAVAAAVVGIIAVSTHGNM